MVNIIIDHCHPMGLLAEPKYAERMSLAADNMVLSDTFNTKVNPLLGPDNVQEIILIDNIIEDDYTETYSSQLKAAYSNINFEKLVIGSDVLINKLVNTINSITSKYPDDISFQISIRMSKNRDAVDDVIEEVLTNRFNALCIEINEKSFPDLDVCTYYYTIMRRMLSMMNDSEFRWTVHVRYFQLDEIMKDPKMVYTIFGNSEYHNLIKRTKDEYIITRSYEDTDKLMVNSEWLLTIPPLVSSDVIEVSKYIYPQYPEAALNDISDTEEEIITKISVALDAFMSSMGTSELYVRYYIPDPMTPSKFPNSMPGCIYGALQSGFLIMDQDIHPGHSASILIKKAKR